MGEQIYREEFTDADRETFALRLEQQLGQLRDTLHTPAFARDEPSIGAELEVYLIDDAYQPAGVNDDLLRLCNNPQLTPEINRYNLEFNLSPVPAGGAPFAALDQQLHTVLGEMQGQAQTLGAKVVPIGILPTLREKHLAMSYMTDRPRYHALARALTDEHGRGVQVDIHGKEDHLRMRGEGVTVEGANTSFQIHLRVAAGDFAQRFNAAQLATPMLVALAANSPLIAGRRLWQESRIALFKQSTDIRPRNHADWRQPARVSFGHGWLREGAWELFAEDVALHPPLVPILFEAEHTKPPKLRELCLHHGTIWPWNRAVYDTSAGGHLRIEFRALPAGPTVIDMMANAALAIGWSTGLQAQVDDLVARLPFRFAEYNFYRAAQRGLDAVVLWPSNRTGGLEERPVTALIEEFLPIAAQGLVSLGVSNSEVDGMLAVAEQRLETRQNGARWQLDRFERYRAAHSIDEACERMLADYLERVAEGEPVATWT